ETHPRRPPGPRVGGHRRRPGLHARAAAGDHRHPARGAGAGPDHPARGHDRGGAGRPARPRGGDAPRHCHAGRGAVPRPGGPGEGQPAGHHHHRRVLRRALRLLQADAAGDGAAAAPPARRAPGAEGPADPRPQQRAGQPGADRRPAAEQVCRAARGADEAARGTGRARAAARGGARRPRLGAAQARHGRCRRPGPAERQYPPRPDAPDRGHAGAGHRRCAGAGRGRPRHARADGGRGPAEGL
ncbi:MAG: hypothetical protein AVDCRST_MAG27-3091, partial [uncultured Craurococcus sp.]